MSNDRKIPTPRRPAAAGGAASRPAPRGTPIRPAPGRPASARPDDEDDEKTAAFNIDDMPFGQDDEKTAAFNIDDLPLDDEPPARQPQRTLVGHPVSGTARKPPVRSSPPRQAPAPAQAQLADPDEATQAMNVDDMLAAIDADDGDDDKTQALSLEEVQAINAAQQAARANRKPTPAEDLIEESAPTVAVKAGAPIPEAAPKRPASAAPAGAQDGFFGSIEYFFSYPSIKARADRGELPRSAVDGEAAKKGFINVSMISGGLIVLTLIAGLLS